MGAEAGGLGDPGHLQVQCIWGQLEEAFNCAGSGVLVAIHHKPGTDFENRADESCPKSACFC